MDVGDLQMGEAAQSQVINRVNPPIRTLAGRFAQAAAIGDAEYPPMPARRRLGTPQQPVGQRFEERARVMQALDQGFVGQFGDTSFACPGRDALQRIAAATPRHRQAQQVGAGPNLARTLERLRLPGQGFHVQARRQSHQKGREMVDRVAGCFGHLSDESYRAEPCQKLS